MKVHFSLLLLLLLSLSKSEFIVEPEFAIELETQYEKENQITDTGSVDFDDSVTSFDLFTEMGFGWNLGNTLDAHQKGVQNQGISSETYWGNPETTEEIIQGLVKAGIKTLRLPITWHNHLVDNNYTIDPEWMNRIKTIVDWGIKNGLYVIINSHHDDAAKADGEIPYGSGYYTSKKDRAESERFLLNIWTQIATAFNNGYDHHLIFECMNEPRPAGTDCEWDYKREDPVCEESVNVLHEYMKLVVKIIRESGGNNEKRFILVAPLAAHWMAALNQDFIFPGDSLYNPTNNKLLFSVHLYIPFNFAANPDMQYTVFDEVAENQIYSTLKTLYEKYILHGHQVIIGEMATLDKNNKAERIAWAKYFVSTAKKFQMPCILWDDGVNSETNVEKGLYRRRDQTWFIPELIEAYVNSEAEYEYEFNPEEIFKDNLIDEPITFVNWENNLPLGPGIFGEYSQYSKLTFTTDEPDSVTGDRKLNIFSGDWGTQLYPDKSEIEGADIDGGSIFISPGKTTVTITLKDEYITLAKEKGLVILGVFVKITSVYISGPKLKQIDPLIITKSTEEEQTVNLIFSENAEPLVGNIVFDNLFNDINKNIECSLNKDEDNVIQCTGKFDFTGEYYLKDSTGMLLGNRPLFVVPTEGEDKDIKNLIDEKIPFNDKKMGIQFKINKEVFAEYPKSKKLLIETTELINVVKDKKLFILDQKTNEAIKFDSKAINVEVGSEGEIIVPDGRQLITINVEDIYEDFMTNGITIQGYGMSVVTIYLE